MPSADYARVLREFARDGYKMITGDAFAAEDVTRRVAKEFPDVAFVFGSGQGPAEPNFSVYDNWIHEPAYLSGLIAGKMTKTNIDRLGRGDGHPRGRPPGQRLLRRAPRTSTRRSSAR